MTQDYNKHTYRFHPVNPREIKMMRIFHIFALPYATRAIFNGWLRIINYAIGERNQIHRSNLRVPYINHIFLRGSA